MELERTTKYVLLKVTVLHEPAVDPEVICEQAVFGYDYEDGAVEGAEVVGVFGVGEIEAGGPKGSPPTKVSPNRVAALVDMMKYRR